MATGETYNSPFTFYAAQRFPLIGNQIWDTYADALAYVSNAEECAVVGQIVSVINDGDNNGLYLVTKVALNEGEKGELKKLGEGSGGGGGGAVEGATNLYELDDVVISDPESQQALMHNGEKWVNRRITFADITDTPTDLQGYGITDAVPYTRKISAGPGLSVSNEGQLNNDITLSLESLHGSIISATYTKVTIDAFGRVINGSSLAESDIPSISSSKISDLSTVLDAYVLRTDYDKDINDSETGLAARIAKIEGWFELDDNNNIRTTYNFYSTKQIASGGPGTASGSGLGLLLTEWPADSEDYSKYALGGNLGIELNTRLTAVEGKATNVTVSPTLSQGKPMGTIMVDGVSQTMYAPASYSADDIVPTQERNFVSLQDIEYWNTAYLPKTGGTFKGSLVPDKDGAYHLGSSSYRLGVVFALQGVFYGGLSINNESVATQTWADGRYLKLGGGAIGRNGSNSFPLNIESTSSYTGIAFVTSGGTAWMRYMGNSDWGVTDAGWKNSYTLIHSGNIGNQTVTAANKLVTSAGDDAVTISPYGPIVMEKEVVARVGLRVKYDADDVAYFGSAQSGLGDTYNGALMYAYGARSLYFYNNNSLRMLINSSGNVTIGSSDLASTDYKLYVDGGTRVATLYSDAIRGRAKDFIIYGYDGTNYVNAIDIDCNNLGLHIGYGSAPKSYNTNICGNVIYLKYGTSRANGLILNSSGNVGIGTTSPEYKLDVNGTARFNGNIVLASDFTVNATTWYVSFGINGALIKSDVRDSWRSTVFGNAGAGSRIKTVRTDVTIDNFSEIYGNGLAWASGDTHGYIGVSYGSKQAFIGGGSSDKLSWTAKLFHNNMTLEPYEDKIHQIGSASKRYTNAYLSNSVRIGNAILSWDSTNNALKIEGNVYVTGQVAAGGVGTTN